MKKAIFVLVIIILPFTGTTRSYASEISLSVSPSIMKVKTTPPAKVSVPFTVENKSSSQVTLVLFLKPFTQSGKENGEVIYTDDQDEQAFLQKIQIKDSDNQVQTIILFPRQKKTLTLFADISSNDLLKDHSFSIILNTKSGSNSQNATSTTIEPAIALHVLLSVGKENAQGLLAEFSAPLFVEQGPLPFTVRIKNTGDHFIEPQGLITVTNMFGQEISQITLSPTAILSQTTRQISDSGASSSSYESDEILALRKLKPYAIWPQKHVFGLYKATLRITLSPSGQTFNKSLYFIAFPYKIFAALIIFALFIQEIRRRMRMVSS